MNGQVLIVEHDGDTAVVLKNLLGGTFPIHVAATAAGALEALNDSAPDVLLIDISLPDLDGLELCRRIKARPFADQLHVVILTAQTDAAWRGRAFEAGADDFLCKPVHGPELLSKLQTQFRQRKKLTDLAFSQARTEIHSDELERQVQLRTAEIVATRNVAVFALAKLAESRDPETGEHLERMRAYSQILGEDLSGEGPYTDVVDRDFLDNLYQSSPLHDIGKVGIPDVILLKPDRLSVSEFDLMQRHTVIGAEALQSAVDHRDRAGGFLEMAADIARCHHERWDGTGYPAGLAGTDIPLAARIVAVADVYDALTSARVYKAAYTPEVARLMILEQEGRHFDPAVVDAFRRSYERFLRVRAATDRTTPTDMAPVMASADIRR